jgi:hypothetical protein
MTVYSSLKGKFHLLAFLYVLLFWAYNVKAQNPANYFTSATYIGGYHIKCNGQSTGSIKANPSFGTAPYTFSWSSGETTAQINNKPAGVYIVTMTDSINVSHSDTFELRQPKALNYQSALSDFYGYNIHRHGGASGSIQLSGIGGTPPYTYLWSNGDSLDTRNGLSAGNYSFTITDANQCSASGSIALTEPNPVQFSFTNIQQVQCFGGIDGAATLDISGGLGNFSVVWNNGNFSLSPNDLTAGYNEVRIYEQGRAIIDTGITITSPTQLAIAFTLSQYNNGYNVSCVDCYNGSISSTVTGGTAPYTYLWNDENNSTTANLNNLNGGVYGLKITDAHGCKMGDGVTLKMPSPKDWSRFGNANIDTAEFIGSTDTSAVVFKTNSQEALRLAGNGNIGVKNSNPTEALDIIGNMKTSGTLKFANNGYISPMVDATGNSVGLFFGSGSSNTNSVPVPSLLNCLSNYSWQTNFQHIVAISDPSTTGLPSLYLGSKNGKALIESSNQGTTSLNTKLYLNFFCGEDVLVGNSAQGNLIATVKLGVGTYSPTERLHVVGSGLFDENLYVTEKIGIGTNTPTQKLEVVGGSLKFINSASSQTWTINNWIPHIQVPIGSCIATTNTSSTNGTNVHLGFGMSNGGWFFIRSSNDIGQNVNESKQYAAFLTEEGEFNCRKVVVQLTSGWQDVVFENNYSLTPLIDLENYIKVNKHLPDVPSAEELKKTGIDSEDMFSIQMKKIEELTLYVISLQKELEVLKSKLK